jgi:hypothetical protein
VFAGEHTASVVKRQHASIGLYGSFDFSTLHEGERVDTGSHRERDPRTGVAAKPKPKCCSTGHSRMMRSRWARTHN